MTARLAAFAALLLPLLPGAAMAAAATASENVNMRSGPAVSYGVVGVLQQGDDVDVRQCEGDFCQVAAAGKSGWVKATYLTRDPVQKPAPAVPQIASVPGAPGSGAVAAPSARQGSLDDLPPADIGAAPDSGDFPPAYDASAPAPRPKATIPDITTPDANDPDAGVPDIYAGAGPSDGDYAVPPVGDDWSWRRPGPPRFGRSTRGDFADYDPTGDARACFLDQNGRLAFCLRDGEGMQMPLRLESQALLLRNPDGLNVSICSVGGRDCRVIVADGPIVMSDRPIATISVSSPGY